MLITTIVIAQIPQYINCQGVARDITGAPITNKAIALKLTIQDPSGSVFDEETHNTTTNTF